MFLAFISTAHKAVFEQKFNIYGTTTLNLKKEYSKQERDPCLQPRLLAHPIKLFSNTYIDKGRTLKNMKDIRVCSVYGSTVAQPIKLFSNSFIW